MAIQKCRLRRPDLQIIIFIDDIDRCSPEKALEMLESVKRFFDFEGFVFVIALNLDFLDNILRVKYGADNNMYSRDFMNKIVQLPIYLPPWEKTPIMDILRSISQNITDKKLSQAIMSNMNLILTVISDPAELKRFVNEISITSSFTGVDIEDLIVFNLLNRRWPEFVELMFNEVTRKEFFPILKKTMDNMSENPNTIQEIKDNYPDIFRLFPTLLDHTDPLNEFLRLGALEKLMKIDEMKEYRRSIHPSEDIDKSSLKEI